MDAPSDIQGMLGNILQKLESQESRYQQVVDEIKQENALLWQELGRMQKAFAPKVTVTSDSRPASPTSPASPTAPVLADSRDPVTPVSAPVSAGVLNASTTPVSASSRSDKLPDPPVFTGKRHELPEFLSKLQYKLEGNADRFPTSRSQFLYANSRLGGDAASLVRPLLDRDIDSLPQLLLFLESTYGDPNRQDTALAKLGNLRQGKEGFLPFFARFRRYASESGLNEIGLIMQLKRSLSDDLRRAMIGVKTPSSLTDYANLISTYDNDLRYLPSRSSASRSSPTRSYASAASPARSNRSKDPDAMDLDKIEKGYAPVGSKERQRRIREGRCFKCGSKGHISPDCSAPVPRSRLASASVSPSRGRSPPTKSSRRSSRSPSESPSKSSGVKVDSTASVPRPSSRPSPRRHRLSDSESSSSNSDSSRRSSRRSLKGKSRA
jgi:Retrotransposon gag protein/Zinc knuckle